VHEYCGYSTIFKYFDEELGFMSTMTWRSEIKSDSSYSVDETLKRVEERFQETTFFLITAYINKEIHAVGCPGSTCPNVHS
jgi:hypothetical protein